MSRNTFLLALTSLFADISSEMLYPILPVFLTENLKAGGAIVGLVEGIAETTKNAVQGFSGALSDKLRRRKPVAVAGYLLSAIAKPFMGIAGVWQILLVGRFADRLGSGIRSAPRDALIAASATEKSRGKAFGLEGAGDNAGAFLGPLLTLALIAVFGIGLRTMFFLAVIPGLLALLMILFVKEHPVAESPQAKPKISLRQFPADYRRYLMIIGLFGLGNSTNAFLILQANDLGLSLTTTILVYAAYNLVAAVISYPAGFLSDRFGRKKVLLAGFVIFAVTYLGFALSRNLWLIGSLFVAYGLYQGIFRSVGKAFASDFVRPEQRAGGVGWYGTVVGLSGMVASLVAGQLWDNVGHAAVFVYGAVFAILGVMALLMFRPARYSDGLKLNR